MGISGDPHRFVHLALHLSALLFRSFFHDAEGKDESDGFHVCLGSGSFSEILVHPAANTP